MIVLSTLNARYAHASLGLRYLRANLGLYREQAQVLEFTIKSEPGEILRQILLTNPRLVGFGVYIWNVTQTLEVVKLLKSRRPEILVVAGGPEISFETESQALYEWVDHIFQGEADFTFRDFVAAWVERGERPAGKVIAPSLPEIKALQMPYAEYSDHDLAQRKLYVEASRGCPYKCEYCLSALDLSVRSFDLDLFLSEMQKLIDRGARQFKFVDRTFNLSPTTSARILEFFLERVHLGLFMHFELVPDRLPDNLKHLIEKFPPGHLQFEIGVQTWSPEVARNVSRRQNYERIESNFKYLRESTGVHTHADLIVGLPGETWSSFAHGFNALYELAPDEIQVGLLKRLKGTPIIRHDDKFKMKYESVPPFQILETRDLSTAEIANLKVFADFWDHVANSGRFPKMKAAVVESLLSPFDFYYALSQHLYAIFQRTHSIHLSELESAVRDWLLLKGWDADFGSVKVKERSTSSSSLPPRQAQHLS